MYAKITGWGKYAPPVIMSNEDMAKVVDTSDEWIYSRSGIKRRHCSHVSLSEMAWLAGERAIAAAGVDPAELDFIAVGTTTASDVCPNTATYVANAAGATNAACFDLNSACTSWFYALNTVTGMIRAGMIRKALVIGAEHISLAMHWGKRESCVLFGDGAGATVVEACEEPIGLLYSKNSTVLGTRELLEIPGFGLNMNRFVPGTEPASLNFDGQGIFKNAVRGMAEAVEDVLQQADMGVDEIDLFIPHQANIRIIETLGKKLNIPPEKVVVRIDEYANTSAASIPLAMCDALEDGRLKPGMNILTATFGGGLTCGAGLIKWGERVTPVATSEKSLPDYDGNVFDLMAPSFDYHNIDISHLRSK